MDDMLFRAELLIRSIKKFSNNMVYFTVIINGNNSKDTLENINYGSRFDCCLSPIVNLRRKGRHNSRWLPLHSAWRETSNYISKNAEVLWCPYNWKIAIPTRWFAEPKMDTCVFIDMDVIACNDLSPLYDLEKNTLHGVPTHKQHLSNEQWMSLGISSQDIMKYYFNFGMIVVPSKYMLDIGREMFDSIREIRGRFANSRCFDCGDLINYHAGQIALAYTLKKMNINTNILENEFNWYDYSPIENKDNIIFLHYMSNQKHIKNRFNLCSVSQHADNEYVKLIKNFASSVYPSCYSKRRHSKTYI